MRKIIKDRLQIFQMQSGCFIGDAEYEERRKAEWFWRKRAVKEGIESIYRWKAKKYEYATPVEIFTWSMDTRIRFRKKRK